MLNGCKAGTSETALPALTDYSLPSSKWGRCGMDYCNNLHHGKCLYWPRDRNTTTSKTTTGSTTPWILRMFSANTLDTAIYSPILYILYSDTDEDREGAFEEELKALVLLVRWSQTPSSHDHSQEYRAEVTTRATNATSPQMEENDAFVVVLSLMNCHEGNCSLPPSFYITSSVNGNMKTLQNVMLELDGVKVIHV